MTPERPLQGLQQHTADLPGLWRQIDDLRAQRGRGLPAWPGWCYLPVAGFIAILTQGDTQRLYDIGPRIPLVTALATWRATQGIYRFDPTVFDAVWHTPLTGDLPATVLEHLPEWCVYVPVDPPRTFSPSPAPGSPQLHGFFAHLEWDVNTHTTELRFLLDTEAPGGAQVLTPVMLHLSEPTLEAALCKSLEVGALNAMRFEADRATQDALIAMARQSMAQTQMANLLAPLVSLTLYLCSATAELADAAGTPRQPRKPQPKKIKTGYRLFAPSQPTTWAVSYRLGAALRQAQAYASDRKGEREISEAEEKEASDTPLRQVRAHIRRAHWHSFWTGPRRDPEQRQLVVKWLPPIPVGLPEDMVPTIRPVA